MLEKIFLAGVLLLCSCFSSAQPNGNRSSEIDCCKKTSDVSNRSIWKACLYSMGELVANQVKNQVDSNEFLQQASKVGSVCRKLRKELEKEAGGSFRDHETEILVCSVNS